MDEISGLAIIKIIDGGTYSTLLIKLKFTCNKAILDIKNKGKDTMILKEGFSAYSTLVMLISRKLTKDKRVVTDLDIQM